MKILDLAGREIQAEAVFKLKGIEFGISTILQTPSVRVVLPGGREKYFPSFEEAFEWCSYNAYV